MMFRLVRFLILTLTLGRIRWLMRLTWLWRLVVFLGVTGWLSKRLRQAIGLDKKASTEIDSAWADALRYTPQPATAGAAGSAGFASAPMAPPAPEVSHSRSEVTGTTADGETETITIDEVVAGGVSESIVHIADDAGNAETLITGSPVDDLDLANLGEATAASAAPAVDDVETDEVIVEEIVMEETDDGAIIIEDIVVDETTNEAIVIDEIVIVEPVVDEADIETQADLEVLDLIETLEASEPEVPEVEAEPEPPKRKRVRKVKEESVAEPLEVTDEDPDPDILIDPDWVRGDGSDECPDSHPVKAKASSMIFYTPESGHYERTIPDVCFAGEEDAIAAGYRAPRR